MQEYELLAHPDLGERVYAILREQILTGGMAPGTILLVAEIARKLGVSRSPVTDAVNRLVADTLVDDVPRKGYFVAKLTAQEYAELIEARLAMELVAAEYAVRRADAMDIKVVQDALAELEGSVNSQGERESHLGWIMRDDAVHNGVVDCAKNRYLSEAYRRLRVKSHLARYSPGMKGGYRSLDETFREHRAIVDALAVRDLTALKEAIAFHNIAVAQFFCGVDISSAPTRSVSRA